MFGGFEDPISQQQAERVLSKSDDEWRAAISVSEGVERPCSLPGVVIELEWSNPDSVVVPHFWLDEKLRGQRLGSILTDELVTQLQNKTNRGTLYVTVQASNGKTRGLLEKHGFRDVYTCEKDAFDEAVIEGRLPL